jgi:ABC-2 type transport system ATP-binding protein
MGLIEVKNLSKTFKKPIRGEGLKGMFKTLFSRKYEEIKAVDNISFNIESGEIVGYIGANGAGKSTTIKMMCGILYPSSGKVVIDGKTYDKCRREINKDMGVVFGQKTQLWWDIPLVETFKILKSIYEVSDEEYAEKLTYLCDLLDLKPFLNQNVRSLSLGQRMRADFAAALIHSPKIVYLDEPTIGLDVLVKDKIRKAIKELNKKYHTTVVLTTHDMKDIENLCSRVIIIENGEIIYDGSLVNIKNKFGDLRTISISLKEVVDIDSLNKFDNKVSYLLNESGLDIKFDANDIKIEEVINYAFSELNAVDLKIKEIGIEDVVKSIFKEEENRGRENV